MAPACGKLSLQRYPPTNRSKSSSGTRRSTADDFSAVCLDSAPELGPTSILSEPSSSAQLQAQALDSDGESDNVNSATPKRTKRQEHTRNNASKYVDLAEDRMHELGVTWDYRRASSVKNFGVLAANDLNLSLTQKHTIAAQQAGVSERSLYKYIHEVDEKGKFISVDGRGKRTQERDLLHDEELKMKLVTFLRANAGVKKQEKTLPQKLHNYVNEQLREYPALKLHWLKKQAQKAKKTESSKVASMSRSSSSSSSSSASSSSSSSSSSSASYSSSATLSPAFQSSALQDELQRERQKKDTEIISMQTNYVWMHKLGWSRTSEKKSVYIDGHEREDVKKYRQEVFLPLHDKYQERMYDFSDPAKPKPPQHLLNAFIEAKAAEAAEMLAEAKEVLNELEAAEDNAPEREKEAYAAFMEAHKSDFSATNTHTDAGAGEKGDKEEGQFLKPR